MAILLTSCTDGVFLVPLFFYFSVACFPLSSTSVLKEKHEEYFTASLKCCCPAQESIDKHQKVVSINAFLCVAILQHTFWLERMCRVTTPGYRVSNKLSFTGSKYGWVWEVGFFSAVCVYVFQCIYAYINCRVLSREDLSATVLFHASVELHFNLVHLGICKPVVQSLN